LTRIDPEPPRFLDSPSRSPGLEVANDTIAANASPYDRVFALSFVANFALTIAVSILYRYSDFVTLGGGREWHLGWIIGFGTAGAISFRVAQGVGVDRYGPRMIWIGCLVGYFISLIWHSQIESVRGVEVYLARLLLSTSQAGSFGCSLAFISLRAPKHRIAETVGMLGSSGFLGMALGPAIGDLLFVDVADLRTSVDRMFYASASFVGLSLICVLAMGASKTALPPRHDLPAWRIIANHQPGFLLVVAAAMGMGVSLPGIFLRPYCEKIGIEGIFWFFAIYNGIAFFMRVYTSRLPDRLGSNLSITIGLCCLSASLFLYPLGQLPVTSNWMMLIAPAFLAGVAHAFLFPAVVAAGSHAFPIQHRGIATALILGCFDIGVMLGAPLVGGILYAARSSGLPEYMIMFASLGAMFALVCVAQVACVKSTKDNNVRKSRK
jgi:MFS family permease